MSPTIRNLKTLVAAQFAMVLAVSLQGCKANMDTPMNNDAAVVAALTRQADQWDKAIVRKDLAAIADNMTPDFRQIRYNGDVVNKDVFLRDITSPDLVIDPYAVEDFDVRIYGNLALLSGRTKMTGRYAGTAFTSHYRYIDIYIKRDGRWRVCSVQITRIPES